MLPLFFVSCSKEVIDNPTDEKFYVVKLGLGAELDVTYESMTKASGDDLYGIQVYSSPNTDESVAYKPYAYGLFDNPEDITIKLLEGYKYKFEATMIVDGKNKLSSSSSNGYWSPFTTNAISSNNVGVSDDFVFSSSVKIDPGKAFTQMKSGSYYVPNIERFYGETTGYIPSEGASVEISMKRVCFAAKFIAQGKFKKDGGKITIQIPDAPVAYIVADDANEHKYEDVYTFRDIKGAYNAAKDNDYEVEMDVNLSWTKGDGATVPFGDYKIKFRRNKKTVINIKVDDKSSGNGIGIIIEEEAITEGDTYTIDPGGSSNNDVEVN